MKLDPNYLYLSKKYWKKHDHCMFLINQIEELVIDKTYNGLRIKSIRLKKNEKIEKDEHVFDFILRIGRVREHNEMVRNQLVSCQSLIDG
jgi:hypothetical protein